MSIFDRIDRQHRPKPRITAPKPDAGDICPDPRCDGRYAARQQTGRDPDRPPVPMLVCTGCGTEVWL